MPRLTLDTHDIHIWRTCPEHHQQPQLLDRYRQLLSADELARQQRYRFARDRHSALVTRAFVRDLLSHYADIPPADWRFVKGEKDKPEIHQPPLPLRFNLSHTNGLIVCAVTLHHDIGIDVEYVDRKNDVLNIADRYFSPDETRELFSLPAENQRSRFFDYWTLKESYIKACGQGLAIPLDHFSFVIGQPDNTTSNHNISLQFAPQRPDTPAHWQSWLFYPNEQHRIALSVRTPEHPPWRLTWFNSTPLVSRLEGSPPFAAG